MLYTLSADACFGLVFTDTNDTVSNFHATMNTFHSRMNALEERCEATASYLTTESIKLLNLGCSDYKCICEQFGGISMLYCPFCNLHGRKKLVQKSIVHNVSETVTIP